MSATHRGATDSSGSGLAADKVIGGQSSNNLRLPTHKAFWSDIQTDDCGYLWLLYPTQYLTLEDTGFVFRIISPAGEYLGDTTWPITAGSLSRGHLQTIRADEDSGELILEIYRIESNRDGFTYP